MNAQSKCLPASFSPLPFHCSLAIDLACTLWMCIQPNLDYLNRKVSEPSII